MKEFILAISAAGTPKGAQAALWEGRDAPSGMVCLEIMVEQRLEKIRESHMRWAFETGALLQDRLKCGSAPSMWWTSLVYERHPKVCPDLYPIYKLACLEMWLVEGGADSVLLLGGSPRLKRVVRRFCQVCGLGFHAGPGAAEFEEKRSLKAKLYNLAPAPLRALARFAHWWWHTRRMLPTCSSLAPLPRPSQNPAATIATYFPNLDMQAAGEGRFRSRYWESLHDALNQQARCERPGGPHFVRWLFIYFSAPGINLRDAIKLRDTFQKDGFDGLSFNFLEEFLTAKDLWLAFRRWFRIAAQSVLLEREFARNCVTARSRLNFWPYMRWAWAESMRGWRCLERCLFNLAFVRYCSLAGPQRWTLFPLENCPWERMLTESARRVPGNGPVFGAQHSTIRPTDFRYFDDPCTFEYPDCAAFQPDLLLANGASALGQWRRNNLPVKRLAQVEALRYLYLAERGGRHGLAQQLPPDRGEPIEPENSRRLLIVTSFFRDETDAHLALVKDCLAAGVLKGWQLTLKAHPYLHPQTWLDSLSPGQRQQVYVSGQPLARELAPGVSVWASNSTTAALEAAIRGLPLMVMAAANDFDLCPIQDVPGLVRTATVADVGRELPGLSPIKLAPDYLDLDTGLPAWRAMLGLTCTGAA